MSKKSKKVEKETRRLMEGISDLVKRKGNRYKFKSKNKKIVKKVKRTCLHWIMRKGKEHPTVVKDPNKVGYWKCAICGASFPVKPLPTPEGSSKTQYEIDTNHLLELVNQMQFLSVELGGDADDTKMFLKLKETLPRFAKVSRQILKHVNRRQDYEKNRENGSMSQFSMYDGYDYN